MIPRIRRGNDFKYIWPITWNGLPEDFSDATDITLTAKVYGRVKTLTEGVNYHIDGGTVMIDFTPVICDIAGPYTVELNYIKPSAEFLDGDRRSAIDVQAFQIVNASAEANATGGVSPPSEAMVAYALKYDDLTEEQKDELRGKGITSIDLTGEIGDTKTYTITYADGATFDFSVTDGHTPIFTFVGTVLYIDGVAGPNLKGETGDKGETGNGIASVELTSTVGLAKTYRITFTDDTATTFTVTDGVAAVVQEKGSNTDIVMSQKAVTDELDQLAGEVSQKASHGYVSSPKTLKQVDDDLALRELKANKQNNLATDGTGTKFPTVDAVNAEFDKHGLVYEYIHSGNRVINISSYDVLTNTFTSAGHGLINGNYISPTLKNSATDTNAHTLYIGGMGEESYIVENVTADTFQVRKNGEGTLDLTTLVTTDLSLWHFEQGVDAIYIENLKPSKRYKIVFDGKFTTLYGYLYISDTRYFGSAGWIGRGSKNNATNIYTPNCYAHIEVDILSNSVTSIKTIGSATCDNSSGSGTTTTSYQIYLYKHYNYGDITDIMARFVDGVLFNGSSIKIYNT